MTVNGSSIAGWEECARVGATEDGVTVFRDWAEIRL